MKDTWRKSSRSENSGACVEVRHTLDEVRDSKNTSGPSLCVDVPGLTNTLKKGLLNRPR